MPGIHVLSVGHVPPGAEIAVESRYVQALSFVTEEPSLRIPTTVGDIYRSSPLIDSDDLVHAPVRHEADLEVTCDGGTVHLTGGALADGRARVLLDAPIDLSLTGWRSQPISGRAADGATVTVTLEWAPLSDRPVNVAIAADRSGSMHSPAGHGQATKFDIMRSGLTQAMAELGNGYQIALWQFDDGVDFIGRGTGPAAGRLVSRLSSPRGCTEIGQALTRMAATLL